MKFFRGLLLIFFFVWILFLYTFYKTSDYTFKKKTKKQSEAAFKGFLTGENGGLVGHRRLGGFYDGKSLILFNQIKDFPKIEPVFTIFDGSEKTLHPSYLTRWSIYIISIFEVLLQNKWKFKTNETEVVQMYITRLVVPRFLKEGYQMVNNIGVSNCIGGTKAQQLKCRRNFTQEYGCTYESLNIQPIQFIMSEISDCESFFKRAKLLGDLGSYISKPINSKHGERIHLYDGLSDELIEKFENCKSQRILMDYVKEPSTMMGGYKWDFRTYVLVASMKPKLLFMYEDGVVRRSNLKFDLHKKTESIHIMNSRQQSQTDHLFDFAMAESALHDEHGFPENYFENVVKPKVRNITKFVFLSQEVENRFYNVVPRAGRFQIFAFDWILDKTGNVFLLEGNKYPQLTYLKPIENMYQEWLELIMLIHVKPKKIQGTMSVKANYTYGRWKLIFNELEEMYEAANGRRYNPCSIFS